MKLSGTERRNEILRRLQSTSDPLSGTALGKEFGVSRQVIVQDIALIRTQGVSVVSTNKGYLIDEPQVHPMRLLKLHHTLEQTEDELTTIVDLGGTVMDVMVNHRAYGQMKADLSIKNRRDVAKFITDIETGASTPLMQVTSGYHFHTIAADTEEILDEIEAALQDMGILAPLSDYEAEHLG